MQKWLWKASDALSAPFGRNIKRHNTHNRYFPEFSDLTTAVEMALWYFQQHPQDVKQLMGSYLDEVVALAAAA